jgi:hypothetical protein
MEQERPGLRSGISACRLDEPLQPAIGREAERPIGREAGRG